MSFSAWLNPHTFTNRLRLSVFRSFSPGPVTVWWISPFISALVLATFIVPWVNPFWIWYSIFALGAVACLVGWQYWLGKIRLGMWLAIFWVLIVFWYGMYLLWLILENSGYRLLFLVAISLFTWWYLLWWRNLKQKLFLDTPLGNLAPPVIISYISTFGLGASAYSLIVFLNTPWWVLGLAFCVPLLLLLGAVLQISHFEPFKRWRVFITSGVILTELFVLINWWPTSFYVAGFTLTSVMAMILLAWRQEGQGFVNTRQVRKELILLLLALVVVLLTARWN